MNIQKFEGATMQEALAQVKKTFGPDAVIFSSRRVSGKGLLGPARIEVTAALDSADSTTLPPDSSSHKVLANASLQAKNEDAGDLSDKLAYIRQELRGLKGSLTDDRGGHFQSMQEQIQDLYRMMSGLAGRGGGDDWVNDVLRTNDVAPQVARWLGGDVNRRLKESGGQGRKAALLASISDILQRRRYAPSSKLVALVGPTGVGKTTTIAKMAANARLGQGKRVVLISVDKDRVGGLEQLRKYAELIGAPMYAAYDQGGFARALSRHPDADLILVDTAGRNPEDVQQIQKLAEMFSTVQTNAMEVHLCLAVATRQQELNRVIRRFDMLDPKGLIFTKWDEAESYGAVLNAVAQLEANLSYITNGQRVPEDIAHADPIWLAREMSNGFVRCTEKTHAGVFDTGYIRQFAMAGGM
jgi:flagellar biosynthesis protein FlhF